MRSFRIRVKIRDEGIVRNNAVYIALGILPDGTKEILGLWIEQTRSLIHGPSLGDGCAARAVYLNSVVPSKGQLLLFPLRLGRPVPMLYDLAVFHAEQIEPIASIGLGRVGRLRSVEALDQLH